MMCFDRNINGNRDVKIFYWDYWSLHRPKKITLSTDSKKIDEKSREFNRLLRKINSYNPCFTLLCYFVRSAEEATNLIFSKS